MSQVQVGIPGSSVDPTPGSDPWIRPLDPTPA